MSSYLSWGAPSYDISSLSILICEPNKNMQILLNQILRVFNVKQVSFADDAAAALSELRTFAPDIIITELRMDPIDGFEFVKLLRQGADSKHQFVPVIMLTGHTEQRHVFAARDTGVTEFLAKPITPNTLYKRLASMIDKPRPFVKSNDYFGPDRRRFDNPNWNGPERRRMMMSDTSEDLVIDGWNQQ